MRASSGDAELRELFESMARQVTRNAGWSSMVRRAC